MTETEWLASADPLEMLSVIQLAALRGAKIRWLRSWRLVRWLAPAHQPRTTVTSRRLHLLGCSIDRAWWPATYGPAAEPPRVEVQERFAEGEATLAELQSAAPQSRWPWANPWDLVTEMLRRVMVAESFDQLRRMYCACTRDIFGNPFGPFTWSPEWRSETAVALAARIYESREFGAMPILADALQDAGCDSAEILDHCRGPGPHVRGCWVVDLVLGKE
jgi:hypothetical protein